MIRILSLVPFYPPHRGGLESHAAEFDDHMTRSGEAHVTVFVPRLPADAPEREQPYARVEVLRYPAIEIIHNYPIPAFWRGRFWSLLREVNATEYDIAISRSRFFGTSLLAGIYAKVRGITWIHIEHGSDFAHFTGACKTKLGILYDKTLGRLVLRWADGVVAISDASTAFVQRLSGRTPDTTIRRGVNVDDILAIEADHDLRARYPDQTLVCFIGRLIDGKGVADLVSAAATLKEQNITYIIVGDGPQKDTLMEQAANLGIAARVVFLGRRERTETISILKACDIFVNPSYNEGLPTSVIEAALAQTAIIATNVGGTPEIITDGEGGILIPAKDPGIIAQSIAGLTDNEDKRARLTQHAYSDTKATFSWPKSAARYHAYFAELLANNK